MTGKRNLLFAEMMHIQKTEKDEKRRNMLDDTQIFLYCKLDLALVCLVLCTKGILEREDIPYFQRLHVTRFEEAYEFAEQIIKQDSKIAEIAEHIGLGVFEKLQTQVDLVCDYCGREIVNMCFTDAKEFDGTPEKVKRMSILCPEHRKNFKNFICTMFTTDEMTDRFREAKEAVEKWKEVNE